MKISVAGAKNKLPELIKAVEHGERVTICRRGVSVVDLVRTKAGTGRTPKFGTLRGRITINDSRLVETHVCASGRGIRGRA